jgi:carbamoyltransferase
MKGALLGPSYSNQEVKKVLDKAKANYVYFEDFDELIALISQEIVNDKVIGWHQGKLEFGPRALGSRSILASPLNTKMQRTLNLKIKYRESFRPFAPIVMEEYASQYFDIDRPSPYMLLVADVKNILNHDTEKKKGLNKLHEKRSILPAITHVDCSARIQTVNKNNIKLYRLLEAFKQITSHPVLINTSFNVRGEPIVCSPQDSLNCFMNTEMDILVIENFVLFKNKQTADIKFDTNQFLSD